MKNFCGFRATALPTIKVILKPRKHMLMYEKLNKKDCYYFLCDYCVGKLVSVYLINQKQVLKLVNFQKWRNNFCKVLSIPT